MVSVGVSADKSQVLDFFGVRQKDLPCVYVVNAPDEATKGPMKKFKVQT